jgi:hypothetical protein
MFNASTMLLLTDGTVLCQDGDANDWWKLTPDQSGSHINGTWSALAKGPNSPLYYASCVLRDGRVFVAGGEYNAGAQVDLLAAEIYNPVTNTWTSIATPAGWSNIGDAPSSVLPDGRVLLGSINDTRTAIYEPVANSWTAGPNKGDASSEETWTLLPDQTVLAIQCSNHPHTEKFVGAANTWVTAGTTPSDLVEAASIETGPCLLLPDGRLFRDWRNGSYRLYSFPPIADQLGSWTAGPDFPKVSGQQLGAKDAPGCLLPNGRVLCAVGPVNGVGGDYLSPTYFFEFDPVSSTLTSVPVPPTNGGPPFVGRMLLLPSGEVLFANGSTNVQVYTPDGAPDPTWMPSITSCPTFLEANRTYTLFGRQLNGLSQAVSYGDDAQMATNYPLVRVRNNATGHVFFCRTHDHSTMSVNTGTVIHSTQFDVHVGIELGGSQLTVIANGISSNPIAVSVGLIKITKEIIKEKDLKEIKEKDLKEIEKLQKELEKVKDAEITAGQGSVIDPELLQDALQQLTSRIGQVEDQIATGRPFIAPEERPSVGEQVIQASTKGKGPRAGGAGKSPRP